MTDGGNASNDSLGGAVFLDWMKGINFNDCTFDGNLSFAHERNGFWWCDSYRLW